MWPRGIGSIVYGEFCREWKTYNAHTDPLIFIGMSDHFTSGLIKRPFYKAQGDLLA